MAEDTRPSALRRECKARRSWNLSIVCSNGKVTEMPPPVLPDCTGTPLVLNAARDSACLVGDTQADDGGIWTNASLPRTSRRFSKPLNGKAQTAETSVPHAVCQLCKFRVQRFPCPWSSWDCSQCDQSLLQSDAVYGCPNQDSCQKLVEWGICKSCSQEVVMAAACNKCELRVRLFSSPWSLWDCSRCDRTCEHSDEVYGCPNQEFCQSISDWGICRACAKESSAPENCGSLSLELYKRPSCRPPPSPSSPVSQSQDDLALELYDHAARRPSALRKATKPRACNDLSVELYRSSSHTRAQEVNVREVVEVNVREVMGEMVKQATLGLRLELDQLKDALHQAQEELQNLKAGVKEAPADPLGILADAVWNPAGNFLLDDAPQQNASDVEQLKRERLQRLLQLVTDGASPQLEASGTNILAASHEDNHQGVMSSQVIVDEQTDVQSGGKGAAAQQKPSVLLSTDSGLASSEDLERVGSDNADVEACCTTAHLQSANSESSPSTPMCSMVELQPVAAADAELRCCAQTTPSTATPIDTDLDMSVSVPCTPTSIDTESSSSAPASPSLPLATPDAAEPIPVTPAPLDSVAGDNHSNKRRVRRRWPCQDLAAATADTRHAPPAMQVQHSSYSQASSHKSVDVEPCSPSPHQVAEVGSSGDQSDDGQQCWDLVAQPAESTPPMSSMQTLDASEAEDMDEDTIPLQRLILSESMVSSTSEPADWPKAEHLRLGGRVRLAALKRKPEFNGKQGVILNYNADDQAWQVQLDDDPQIYNLKSQNLVAEDKVSQNGFGQVKRQLAFAKKSKDARQQTKKKKNDKREKKCRREREEALTVNSAQEEQAEVILVATKTDLEETDDVIWVEPEHASHMPSCCEGPAAKGHGVACADAVNVVVTEGSSSSSAAEPQPFRTLVVVPCSHADGTFEKLCQVKTPPVRCRDAAIAAKAVQLDLRPMPPKPHRSLFIVWDSRMVHQGHTYSPSARGWSPPLHRPPFFDPNDVADWRSVLDKEGFTVIADVLPQQDVEEALRLLYSDLQGFAPKLRNLDEVREFHLPPTTSDNDLRTGAGLCHGRFAWFLRTHPQVSHVFEQLFDMPQGTPLVGSVDVVALAPPGTSAGAWGKQWLHLDYSPPQGCMWQACLQLFPDTVETGSRWERIAIMVCKAPIAWRSPRSELALLSCCISGVASRATAGVTLGSVHSEKKELKFHHGCRLLPALAETRQSSAAVNDDGTIRQPESSPSLFNLRLLHVKRVMKLVPIEDLRRLVPERVLQYISPEVAFDAEASATVTSSVEKSTARRGPAWFVEARERQRKRRELIESRRAVLKAMRDKRRKKQISLKYVIKRRKKRKKRKLEDARPFSLPPYPPTPLWPGAQSITEEELLGTAMQISESRPPSTTLSQRRPCPNATVSPFHDGSNLKRSRPIDRTASVEAW